MQQILKQRFVKVDGKVKTDTTYPAGYMDVISIDKTDDHFRLVYDAKGRFVVHKIQRVEAEYKLCQVKKLSVGKGGVPYIVTHDGRTLRYPDPDVKVRGGICCAPSLHHSTRVTQTMHISRGHEDSALSLLLHKEMPRSANLSAN